MTTKFPLFEMTRTQKLLFWSLVLCGGCFIGMALAVIEEIIFG